MIKALFSLTLLLSATLLFAADVKISQLPLGTGAGVGANDSAPYVDATASTTKRLKLFDFLNIPGLQFVGDTGAGGQAGFCPAPAAGDTAAGKFLKANGLWAAPTGTGTVTSVALTVPAIFSVSGSPVTTSGTLAVTENNQSANLILSGPTSGIPATPTYRSLVGADLPNPSSSTLGGIESYAAVTHQWIDSISTSGVPSSSQPAFSDISGNISVTQMNSGTGASSSTFWRGDGTWATAGSAPPLTTKGDIFTFDTGDARLPVGTNGQVLSADSTQTTGLKWVAAGGSGTVTSVALTAPVEFSVSGSPVTTSGTLAVSWANEAANTVLAGPTSGVPATPGYRALVAADIPALPYSSSTLTNTHFFVGNVSNVAADVAMSGDATLANTGAVTIANNAVTNAKAAQMAANSIKGNNTGSTANATDLTATQVTAMLNNMVGDSGAGGTKGLVPAPAAGDTAAGKFLKADGTWTVPTSSGGAFIPVIQVKSTNYTVQAADDELIATAGLIFTLPDCTGLTGNHDWLVLNDSTGGTVTITAGGANVFDPVAGSGTTFQLTDPGAWVRIACNKGSTLYVYQ